MGVASVNNLDPQQCAKDVCRHYMSDLNEFLCVLFPPLSELSYLSI